MSGEPADGKLSGNLPRSLNSSFIGREAEVSRLLELVPSSPLLTLVGAGGVGKSRLAHRLALELGPRFADGVWLIELAPLTQPAEVATAIADVLGLRDGQGQLSPSTLAERLAGRQVLLILDSCEHLVQPCAEVVAAALERGPHLRVLATSREPLRLAGELVWRVAPLSLPDVRAPNLLRVLHESDAARLCVARILAARPTFTLTHESAQAVASICRQVDGLPLAIELAAAQVATLGVHEVATRLQRRLALLISGARATPARHHTLRATLDWSYALLTEPQRVLLRRLAVFVGGCGLEAAETVCSDVELPFEALAAELAQLVSKSLVELEPHLDGARYRLLETVREYARERLLAADEAAIFERRHAEYVLALSEQVSPEASDVAHARTLEREQENLRAALQWAVRTGQADLGLRLASAAYTLWYFRGHYAEGTDWFKKLLALPAAEAAPSHAEAVAWAGQLLQLRGQYTEATARLSSALDEQRRRGDARGAALTQVMLGNVALWRGDLSRAIAVHQEAAEQLRALGSPAELVSVFQWALAACELGELHQASELAARCEVLGHASGRPVALAAALHLRALVAARRGRAATPVGLLLEAIELERRIGDRQRTVETLIELGHVVLDQGVIPDALQAFGEAIDLSSASGERIGVTRALEGMARGLAISRPGLAVRVMASASAERDALGATAWPSDRRRGAGWLAGALARLGGDDYQAAWSAGRATPVADTLAMVQEVRPPLGQAVDRSRGPLTAREEQVAVLVAQGLSSRQIAERLVISVATVRVHLDHILAKLDLHSRTQVAVWVWRRHSHDRP